MLIYWNECYLKKPMASTPGEFGSAYFLAPITSESSDFMNLACFLIINQVIERETAMQLLLYTGREGENTKRLVAAVRKVIPKGRIETFKSLKDFGARLQTPVEPDSVAVLSASSQVELRQMQLLHGLLPEIYIVLVIPDRKKDTIELAHHLLPRFLSQEDSDFADLKMVLNRMYVNSQKSQDRKVWKES